jgi:hypothetical protein
MANARMYHERHITYALEADEDGVIDQEICTVLSVMPVLRAVFIDESSRVAIHHDDLRIRSRMLTRHVSVARSQTGSHAGLTAVGRRRKLVYRFARMYRVVM